MKNDEKTTLNEYRSESGDNSKSSKGNNSSKSNSNNDNNNNDAPWDNNWLSSVTNG